MIEACIRAERWDQAADYLVEGARRLERGGAEHRVTPEVEAAVSMLTYTSWTSLPMPPWQRAQIGSGCWGPHQSCRKRSTGRASQRGIEVLVHTTCQADPRAVTPVLGLTCREEGVEGGEGDGSGARGGGP